MKMEEKDNMIMATAIEMAKERHRLGLPPSKISDISDTDC